MAGLKIHPLVGKHAVTLAQKCASNIEIALLPVTGLTFGKQLLQLSLFLSCLPACNLALEKRPEAADSAG